MPLAPGRERAVASFALCEAGRLELAELFAVCFSMNTAISSSNSTSRASTSARLCALILPAAHSASNRAFSASNSLRSDALLTVAIYRSASTAIIAPSTARRSPCASAA